VITPADSRRSIACWAVVNATPSSCEIPPTVQNGFPTKRSRARAGTLEAVLDLGPLLDAAPAVIVLGPGYHGRVTVPEDTLAALR